jgi:hypothetical protein
MSNGRRPVIRLRIEPRENEDLRRLGCSPLEYFAQTDIIIFSPELTSEHSGRLPFRLDTGAFASLIPERWLKEMHLGHFLEPLSEETIRFRTAAGRGEGRLAANVPVAFADSPGDLYRFDFIVTKGLNDRRFGLIALRDVIKHFTLHSIGAFSLGPSEQRADLPDLMMVARAGWQPIPYRCPEAECPADVWGQPGLQLICGDHNRKLNES